MFISQALQTRNAKFGVCKLPREILAYIFKMAQRDWSPTVERRDYQDCILPRPEFYSGWMCVTHVCSLWRVVRRTCLDSNPLVLTHIIL